VSLKQLISSIFGPAKKVRFKTKGGYLIVDFRDEYVKLPSGEVIPKNRIVNIDTERKVIIYLDDNNMLREAKYI